MLWAILRFLSYSIKNLLILQSLYFLRACCYLLSFTLQGFVALRWSVFFILVTHSPLFFLFSFLIPLIPLTFHQFFSLSFPYTSLVLPSSSSPFTSYHIPSYLSLLILRADIFLVPSVLTHRFLTIIRITSPILITFLTFLIA